MSDEIIKKVRELKKHYDKLSPGRGSGKTYYVNESARLFPQIAALCETLWEEKSCCHCKSKNTGFFTCQKCETEEDERYRKMHKDCCVMWEALNSACHSCNHGQAIHITCKARSQVSQYPLPPSV